MRKNRLLACLLAMLLLVSAIPASAEGASEPLTLKMYVGNPGFNQSGWGTDIVSTTIIEKTGINLEFEISPEAENQKLQLLIASGDLPDIILVGGKSVPGVALVENDRVWSLDELSEKYDPDYINSEFIVGNRKYLESPIDGKIYVVPSEFTDRTKLDDGVFLMPAPGYYYRKDINDAIGAPKLETLDDLAANARLAYDQDPMSLTHPIFLLEAAASAEYSGVNVMYYAMGGKGIYYEENGKLESRVRDPLYKETLMFINGLVNEGLINPSDFTDLNPQQDVINAEGGYYAAVGPYWRALVPHDQMPLTIEGAEIDVVRPLKQPGVEKPYAPVTNLNGWDGLFISKTTQYPEEAFNFVKFLQSDEGQLLVTAGIENEHWAWGGPENNWVTLIGEAKEKMTTSWNDWVGFLGTYTYQWTVRNYYDSALCWGLAIDDPFKGKVYEYENCGTDAGPYENIDPAPSSDEGVIRVKYFELWKSYIARICTANSGDEASKLYDEMVAAFDQLGLAKLEDAWTANYQAKNA